MPIKGPVPENRLLGEKRYNGVRGVDINALIEAISNTVVEVMDTMNGLPVIAKRDDYKIGGGLFGSGSTSPAIVFSSRQHTDYANVFVAFKITGAILEITMAQCSPTSRNYQKVQQGKLFADKNAAAEEDTYYGALCQAIEEACESIG